MQPRSAARLYDMRSAMDAVLAFVGGKSFEDYDNDLYLRSAVERQLTILGEAMTMLSRTDPETAARISKARAVVGLRNVLVHRYMRVENDMVWSAVERNVAPLRAEIEELLKEAPE